MSIRTTRKFFLENAKLIGTGRNADTVAYNLNAGLMNLVDELHSEIQQLHAEIAQVSKQVAQIARR